MSIQHFYSQTVADGTATSVVRPSDWNSAHNQVLNIGGNTAGTSQISGADIVWAGGNNVTLSANGSTVSVVGPSLAGYLTTAAQSNHSHNFATTTTNGSNVIVATTNSAGVTMAVPAFLTTAGATNAITTAAQSNHSHNFATTTTGGSNIVVGTTNSAGATIGVPAFLTTAAQTNVTSGRAGTGTTFAGTNATATLGVDTNGVALSLSVAGGGVINQTGPNIAVAGSTITSGDVYFSNSPTVTFGMAGSTITASAAGGGGGGGVTVPYYEPYALGNNTSIFVFGQNTLYMQPLLPVDNVIVSNVELQVSIATTTTAAASNNVARTIKYGLYEYGTGASSGSLTLLGSSSMYINIYCDSNVSAGYTISQGTGSFTTTSAGTAVNSVLSGQKYMYFPFSTTLNAGGNYQWVMHMSSASTLSSHANRTFGLVILTNQTATTWGKIKTNGASISAASYLEEFDGRVYTATSTGLPSVFAESNCSVMNSKARLYLKFENE